MEKKTIRSNTFRPQWLDQNYPWPLRREAEGQHIHVTMPLRMTTSGLFYHDYNPRQTVSLLLPACCSLAVYSITFYLLFKEMIISPKSGLAACCVPKVSSDSCPFTISPISRITTKISEYFLLYKIKIKPCVN